MRRWVRKLLGNKGERLAARHLRRQGLTIIERQHSNRFGEIDLIARDGNCIVFVEVKTRTSLVAGLPAEAVTRDKQQKLTRTALAWLKRRGLLERRARFDVVSIVWPKDSKHAEICHIKNAFEPTGVGQMYS